MNTIPNEETDAMQIDDSIKKVEFQELQDILLNLESQLDQFVQFSTDSNFDYLTLLTDSLNTDSITNTLFESFTKTNGIDIEGNELPRKKVVVYKRPTVPPNNKSYSIPNQQPLSIPFQQTEYSNSDTNLNKKRKTDFFFLPFGQEPSFSMGVTNRPTIPVRGGATTNECNGSMIESANPLYKSFLDLSRFKTEEERDHDFKADKAFSPDVDSMFSTIYHQILETMHQLVSDTQDNHSLYELFQTLMNSSIHCKRDEKEWNYYKTILQYIDKECGRLNGLTVVKYCDEESFRGDSNVKQQLLEDGYFITIPNSAGGEKRYFMLTIDNKPVEPIFNIKDIQLGFEDNGAPFKMLTPLVMDTEKNDKGRIISAQGTQLFLNSIIRLTYGPGMCDPKNTASTPMRRFWSNNDEMTEELFPGSMDTSKLLYFQVHQDINCPGVGNLAKKELMAGLQSFFQYFGSELLVKNVQFIVSTIGGSNIEQAMLNQVQDGNEYTSLMNKLSQTILNRSQEQTLTIPTYLMNEIEKYHYVGIRITFQDRIEFLDIVVTDNNIENVRNVVEALASNRYSYVTGENPSWNRLIKIATLYFNTIDEPLRNSILNSVKENAGIPPEKQYILVLIVILKSLGDSLQVNYVKSMIPYFSNENAVISISSTDKNVGAESFLYNSNALLAGTGIRPHDRWVENHPDFFNNDNISKGSDTITTNLSLANEEKYIDSILDTYTKMSNYFVALSAIDLSSISTESGTENQDTDKEVERDGQTWGDKIQSWIAENITNITSELELSNSKRILLIHSLDTIYSSGILNSTGEKYLDSLIEKYCESVVYVLGNIPNKTPEEIEKNILVLLEEIDKFNKKILDVVRYCDPDIQRVTSQKLENLTSSNQSEEMKSSVSTGEKTIQTDESFSLFDFGLLMKKIESFHSVELAKAITKLQLVTLKWDLTYHATSIENALTNLQKVEGQNTSIFTLLEPFISEYMNNRYLQGMQTAEEKYKESLEQFKNQLKDSLQNMAVAPTVRKSSRSSATMDSSEEKQIEKTRREATASLNDTQIKQLDNIRSAIGKARKQVEELKSEYMQKFISKEDEKVMTPPAKTKQTIIQKIASKGSKVLQGVKKLIGTFKITTKQQEVFQRKVEKAQEKLRKEEQAEKDFIQKIQETAINKFIQEKQKRDPSYIANHMKNVMISVVDRIDESLKKLSAFSERFISTKDLEQPTNNKRKRGGKLQKETKKRKRLIRKYKTISKRESTKKKKKKKKTIRVLAKKRKQYTRRKN